MAQPVFYVLVGPNGAGKSTFVAEVLQPETHLPFVNADLIAAEHWPGSESEHAYEASRLAAEQRDELIARRASFITETVFSHPSKLDLLRRASASGYLVHLYVVLVPEQVSVERVEVRVDHGGHSVPEVKIRERYARLWTLVRDAVVVADRAVVFDNSSDTHPFRTIATYEHGRESSRPTWPGWTPSALSDPR